jgi:hypothetical protein
MQLIPVITCPIYGHKASETMPADACQFFYDCNGCGARLKPEPGDCCVFCSYGSVPCPPIQQGGEISQIRQKRYWEMMTMNENKLGNRALGNH